MMKLLFAGIVLLASANATAPVVNTNYVWMTNPAANQVDIRNAGTGAPITTLAGPFNFVQPWDIVSVPRFGLVLVSNAGVNVVTMINANTLQKIMDVTIPNASNLKGMSVSADESVVFVCGQEATNGPRVWRIDLPSGTLAQPGGIGIPDPTRTATDCCVVRVGPIYKVYYSVTLPAPGYIGIVDGTNGVQLGSISALFNNFPANPPRDLTDVEQPALMERTPDERFVFVGCTKNVAASTSNTCRIIRIDAATDAASRAAVEASVMNQPHQVIDVSFRTDPGIGNRGFVLAVIDGSPPVIIDIDDTGAKRALVPDTGFPVALPGPPAPVGSVRFAAVSEQVFVGGDIAATTNTYTSFNAKTAPVSVATNLASGFNPVNFVVVAESTAVIADICPRAGDGSVTTTVTITGSGFVGVLNVTMGGAPVPFIVIDSTTINADVPAGPAANLNVVVVNRNGTSGQMDRYYVRMAAPFSVPGFTMTVPSPAQGYQMLSVPQYTTMASVLQGFAAKFGPYNPSIYRIFLYRNGAYVEAPNLGPEVCDIAGESFWVLTRFGGTVDVAQPDVWTNAAAPTDLRAIPIGPGWNMISVPFQKGAGLIPWGAVTVTSDPTNFAGGSSTTSPAGQAMVSAAIGFVAGTYQSSDPIQTGNGYWVLNQLSQTIYLVFDPALVAKPGQGPPVSTKPLAAGDPVPPAPPGAGVTNGSSGKRHGCGLLGPELLLIALAFPLLRRRRRLGA